MIFFKKYSLAKFIIPLFLLLWTAIEGVGQPAQKIQFHHLTPEDGLSQSTVYAILQDSEGYMWFATQDGLNKYNGYEVSIYRNESNDPHSISSNDIRSLYQDKNGNLWIGTLGGGLNLYDRDMDQFIRFKGDIDHPQESLSDNSIWDIYEDNRGNFWVATSWGLNLLKRHGERDSEYLSKVTHFITESDNPTSISSNNISAIYEDSRGNLWVGTEEGLNILDRETGEFKRFMHDSEDQKSIGANHITTIYEDQKGTLWIGTLGGGLNYYDYESQNFYQYLHDKNDPYSIAENSVYAIREDRRGMLWIGTSNQGLDLFDPSQGLFYHYQPDQEDPNSINNNAVNSIYESNDNIFWVGTFMGGVNFTDRKNQRFEHFKSNPNFAYSISNNVVRSFLETRSGVFLVGTDGGGLNIFDRETGRFSVLKHDPHNSNSIPSDVILDIKEDQEGRVWLGTYDGGLSLFDMNNHTFKVYQHDPGDSKSLGSDDIFELLENKKGELWIGTNRGGVSVMKSGSGEFVSYMEDPEKPNSIENNDIRSIYEDSEGTIWIGSYGGRLARFNGAKKGFTHFNINQGKLYSSVIQSIHEDKKQRLWLGTRGGGLKLFDRETHEVKTYSTEDGLPSNIINGILEDESGNLWISSTGGISKFDPQTETITNYNAEDGLQGSEFSIGAYYKDRKGYMYFGGVNGFNRFHPDSIRKEQRVPPIALVDFMLFNKTVTIGEDSPLKKHINQTERLVLPYSASVLTFEYVALNFNPIKGNRYAYKLLGFDKEWNYVGGKRTATYTNLDPGNYTLKIKASNKDGVWNQGTELAMVITPPFWQTSWFYTLSIILIVGILYLSHTWRMKHIRKLNEKLERKVNDRTSELNEKNEKLTTALQELKETRNELVEKARKAGMADIASGVLHNVGNILNSVNTSAWLISDTVKQSKLEGLTQANEILRQHVNDLEHFIIEHPKGKKLIRYYLKLEEPLKKEQEKVFIQSKRLIEKIKFMNDAIAAQQSYAGASMYADQISLSKIIDNSLALQAGSIERHGLDVEKDLQAEDSIIAHRSKLIHVLVNIFKNAKEAMAENPPGNKRLTIKTRQDEKWVYLSISDNGEGIKENNINKIFTQEFTTKKEGHGFGLHSSANYMAEIGGNIEANSDGEGQGATFTLTFPKLEERDDKSAGNQNHRLQLAKL